MKPRGFIREGPANPALSRCGISPLWPGMMASGPGSAPSAPPSAQLEFLLVGADDGTSQLADPLGELRAQIAAAWELPLGQRVRVDLRDDALPGLDGRLELARAPELPLDPNRPLALRIDRTEFSSRQIVAWLLA